ncbi:hypothetical protein NPX13_g9139 [Xylaria arbuscula]|uniref:Protein kinase domain-containing protein n=1 Tax=Xylaria arbuscula TaxID=114810 RepID=A0A9W8TIR8_9PEZI|nr:hypothetical protein NPX13_g9139 [Xylaria arbuscula]
MAETVITFVSLAIAIPGLVQTTMHAARCLSNKLHSIPSSQETTEINALLQSLDKGIARAVLDDTEDLYYDTPDPALKTRLRESASSLRKYLLELEKQVSKLDSVSASSHQGYKAIRTPKGSTEDISELITKLRGIIHRNTGSRTLPSRLELRSPHFCHISQSVELPRSLLRTIRCDFRHPNMVGPVDCIVEEKFFSSTTREARYRQAVDLAQRLQLMDVRNGLLKLAGFYELTNNRYQLVFPYPEGWANPRSFRDILLDQVNQPKPPIPRNYRFALPRYLAEAVYQVHSQNLVHKCIRPESILLFEPISTNGLQLRYPAIIGNPFLADWHYTRAIDEASCHETYHDWVMAMYQHPERQAPPGSEAESRYHIGHDIYSLGVCLLEIGLWDSFVVYNEGVVNLSPVLRNAKATWRAANEGTSTAVSDAQIEKSVFIALAGDVLAYEMGEAYSKLVIQCLTCVEGGFGNIRKFVDSSSPDWDKQGTLFIQEVRKQLTNASTMGMGIYNR